MNVLYIFNDITLGGAGQSLIDTLSEIKSKVKPIVIIRKDVPVGIENVFVELGICFYKIPFLTDYIKIGDTSKEKKILALKQDYEAAMLLIPIINKENIHLIHINSSVSSFAAVAALMSGIPYVWHIRELMDEHYGCEPLSGDVKQCLYINADKIITISDYVRRKCFEKYGIDSLRIYNGVNIKKYKLDIDMEMSFPNVFLLTGMIYPEKGQWDAIQAVEFLIQKGYEDVRLIIVGANGGRYEWALNKYIKGRKLDKNIRILPFQKELTELHRQASYALTCSQNEALGRASIEAMLAGNIVIGARSGGTIEIIGENEERGFLYEVHNSEALAGAMIRAMQCPQEIKEKMVKRAQTYASEVFDSKKYCRKLINVYQEVIRHFKQKKQQDFLSGLKECHGLYGTVGCHEEQENDILNKKSEAALELALKWLEIKQNGYGLESYFRENGIKDIAIYGMAGLGCRLYDELEESAVEVKCLLDREPGGMDSILDFGTLDGGRLEVDAIVVTIALSEKQVIDEIRRKVCQKVIGLSEILDSFH